VIVFVYGTTGELIKLAPVMRRLEAAGERCYSISTHQQASQIRPMCAELGLRPPELVLWGGFRGSDLSKTWEIPFWLALLTARFLRHLPELFRLVRGQVTRGFLVVHGDTMTTVVGAVMGRLLHLPVAHIEAGLRSHDWRHPFPEEINRRLVARIADVHYAPSAVAVNNLARARGEVLSTGANTVRDSLDLVPVAAPFEDDRYDELTVRRFGLVSIHRFELLANEQRLRDLLVVLREESVRTPLLFIDHPVTAAKLDSLGLASLFDDDRFVRVPRLPYGRFVNLLRRSSFLVTDSGGSQEECSYLNHPCLVHRLATERDEGLGTNVVLSRFDLDVVRRFLEDPDRYRSTNATADASPSDFIVDDIRRRIRRDDAALAP
jgi:UDP-N-acetylglucosamine 2-epimerase (non-hydrolysing)